MEKISRTGQIGHKKPHKTCEEHRRELRAQLYPGMTDAEIREAERRWNDEQALARQAFFGSVQSFFDYRLTTPQWAGGKAHRLWLLPKRIPTHCKCRHCRRDNTRHYVERYNTLVATFPPEPPLEDDRRRYQEVIRHHQATYRKS